MKFTRTAIEVKENFTNIYIGNNRRLVIIQNYFLWNLIKVVFQRNKYNWICLIMQLITYTLTYTLNQHSESTYF